MNYEGDSQWVELGECDSLQELMVVRGLLESEGIECFCPTVDRHAHKGGYPGFPLHVQQADLAKARALLDATPEFSSSDFPAAGPDEKET